MARLYQGSFNAGEVAPDIYGRLDLERFNSSLRICRNMFPLAEGGLMKRPGLEFVGHIPGIDGAHALAPFKFNNEQTFMFVLLDDLVMIAQDGGFIVTDFPHTITAAGQDVTGPYVDYAASATLTVGDYYFWSSGKYSEMSGRWLKVTASTSTRTHFEDPVSGTIDASGYADLGGIPVVSKVFTLDNSDGWFSDGDGGFASPDPRKMDYTAANDVLYVANEGGPTKEIRRNGANDNWLIVDFDGTPSQVSPTNLVEGVGSNKPAGTETQDYAVTAIETANGTFEESLAALVTVTALDPDLISPTNHVELDFDHMAGADKYRIYKAASGIYGLIGLVEGASGTLTYRDEGRVPNQSIAPPLEANVFDGVDKYPGAVELFQQRILLGRTNNLLRDFYMSRSGSLSSFATSTVSTDDDPIEQAIVAKSTQEVHFFIPLKNLVILTSDGEWGFDTGELGALSPSSGLVAQSFWGSERVKPALVGNSAIFVEKAGSSLRDLAYALQEDGFASSNISALARHLFKNRKIISICYAQSPHQILFCVLSDGRAVSCTYVRDQQVFAWARHDTDGEMKACASLYETDRDNIYVTVVRRRASDGTSYTQLERMVMASHDFVDTTKHLDNMVDMRGTGAPVTMTDPEIDEGEFHVRIPGTVADDTELLIAPVVGGLTRMAGISVLASGSGVDQTDVPGGFKRVRLYRHLNGEAATKELLRWEEFTISTGSSAIFGAAYEAISTATGLHHLVDRNVDVRAGHTMINDQTVSDGGTLSIATPAAVVNVGEIFTTEIETLDIDDISDPVTGAPIQIGGVLFRFENAVEYLVGRNRGSLTIKDLAEIDDDEDFNMQTGAFEGVREDVIDPKWARQGRIVIKTENGFPLGLLAIVPNAAVGDLDSD